jgi:cytochrome c biogenesis protein CcmG, thiol:disulfide interchange protein DsbE
VAVVVVATAFVLDDDDSPTPQGGTGAPTRGVADVGDLAPDFTLPTLDGETISLSDRRGRPTVVNFWASWCHPCREEFPLLADALDEDANEDLAVVGVTYQDIESDSRAFVEEMDAVWPQAVDRDGAVAQSYGVRAIPLTFFVDADGRIADRVIGFSTKGALDESLAKILPAKRDGSDAYSSQRNQRTAASGATTAQAINTSTLPSGNGAPAITSRTLSASAAAGSTRANASSPPGRRSSG